MSRPEWYLRRHKCPHNKHRLEVSPIVTDRAELVALDRRQEKPRALKQGMMQESLTKGTGLAILRHINNNPPSKTNNKIFMDRISSNMFLQAWLETVHNRKEQLLKIWRRAREFTSHVKGDDASIMKEVADKLHLSCYHSDYYCLDTVLYKEEDLVPGRPQGSYWFRDIRVAFEHENNFNSGLYQEVSHLLITNCDLRVLVTYPNDDGQEQLDYLHNVIQGNRQSQIISDDESFLIIFGSLIICGSESDFSWDGYVYKQDDWKRLSD